MKVASVSNYNVSVPKVKYNTQLDYAPAFKSSSIVYKQIGGIQKFLNKIFKRNLCDCNFSKLEGVQRGLKSFEGLSIKQMAFAFTDLHSINMINGCTNHCLHCYANAQPYIKRYPFEDLVQICADAKEFKNRTGVNLAYHHGYPYVDTFFDSDALDCHLYDRNGGKHDYVEIAKILNEGLGYKSVFDTNGWDRNDELKQKIADEYVEKLMQDENYKKFYQVNISINPFNPKYVKVLNSGYSVNELYQPLKEICEEAELREAKLPDDFKKARDMYMDYLKNVVNVLCTFKPLLEARNFSIITRVLNNEVETMKGFRLDDFVYTLQHIYSLLDLYSLFGKISEEELNKYANLLGRADTNVFSSGRMEKFYKVKNQGSLTGIDKIDSKREECESQFEKIKATGSLR